MTEIVQVDITTVTKDGETIFRARGRGFQGLAVVASSRDLVVADAEEVVAALRRVRGQGAYRLVFVDVQK